MAAIAHDLDAAEHALMAAGGQESEGFLQCERHIALRLPCSLLCSARLLWAHPPQALNTPSPHSALPVLQTSPRAAPTWLTMACSASRCVQGRQPHPATPACVPMRRPSRLRRLNELCSAPMLSAPPWEGQVLSRALEVFGLRAVPLRSPDAAATAARADPTTQQAFICNLQEHWFTIRSIHGQVGAHPGCAGWLAAPPLRCCRLPARLLQPRPRSPPPSHSHLFSGGT